MNDKKKKNDRVKLTTPIGEAGYCAIVEPTSYQGSAESYQVKLILDEPEASELIKMLEPHYKAAIEYGKEAWGKEKISVRENSPFKSRPYYKPEYDENERKTGRTIFSFKKGSSGTSRISGKDWVFKLPLYDRFGDLIKDATGLRVYSGSLLRISFNPQPYYVAATGCGLSLQPIAVQIIKAVSGGARSAESYGFGAVGGYDDTDEKAFGSYNPPKGTDEDDVPF